jgi:pyruvate,water dikinase
VSFVEHLTATTDRDAARLGGKGSGLAFLLASGVRIPPAFVVTADGYRHAVSESVRRDVARRLVALPHDIPADELESATAEIRRRIFDATEGHALSAEVQAALSHLREVSSAGTELAVAVRSSSIAEDAADKSFAGEHDTYLWVPAGDVDRRLRECWASLVTARAVAYRGATSEDDLTEMAMAVVVQEMAPARSAGVMMTLNPVNGDRSKIMIESVWGLGEPLVSGEATPDRFLVDKITGEIIVRDVAEKPSQAVRDLDAGGIRYEEVDAERGAAPSLTSDEIAELVRVGRALEKAAGGAPQDAEFAVVGGEAPDNVRLLQCRPETVWANRPRTVTATGRTALESVLATLTAKATPPTR